MHKVVLEAGSEAELRKVADKLTEAAIDHKLWIEQPENFPTCLAVKPYQKEVLTNQWNRFLYPILKCAPYFQQVQKYFKKYKLYKGPEIVKSDEK